MVNYLCLHISLIAVYWVHFFTFSVVVSLRFDVSSDLTCCKEVIKGAGTLTSWLLKRSLAGCLCMLTLWKQNTYWEQYTTCLWRRRYSPIPLLAQSLSNACPCFLPPFPEERRRHLIFCLKLPYCLQEKSLPIILLFSVCCIWVQPLPVSNVMASFIWIHFSLSPKKYSTTSD